MPLDIVPEESSEEVKIAFISEIKNTLNDKISDCITEKMWKNRSNFLQRLLYNKNEKTHQWQCMDKTFFLLHHQPDRQPEHVLHHFVHADLETACVHMVSDLQAFEDFLELFKAL